MSKPIKNTAKQQAKPAIYIGAVRTDPIRRCANANTIKTLTPITGVISETSPFCAQIKVAMLASPQNMPISTGSQTFCKSTASPKKSAGAKTAHIAALLNIKAPTPDILPNEEYSFTKITLTLYSAAAIRGKSISIKCEIKTPLPAKSSKRILFSGGFAAKKQALYV